MVEILSEKIHDNRFLRLLRNMLKAGYLEDWVWNATLSGAPQGGCASPILSNIYLYRLDEFVETVLIPEYTRGGRRARNPAYLKLQYELAAARRRGDRDQARQVRDRMRYLPVWTSTISVTGGCGMRATPARQTRAPLPSEQLQRLRHRANLRSRVPGHRPVLPTRR